MIVPYPEDRENIIREYHETTGHGGIDTVKYHVLRRFTWRGANKDINRLVKECEICQQERNSKQKKGCHAMPTSNVGERWEMDLIGPILDKKDEPKYIATGIDVFSREAWAKVIGHKTGKSIIKCLREAIAEHGRPKIILSDNGREFKNQEVEDFCKKEGITIKHGSHILRQLRELLRG